MSEFADTYNRTPKSDDTCGVGVASYIADGLLRSSNYEKSESDGGESVWKAPFRRPRSVNGSNDATMIDNATRSDKSTEKHGQNEHERGFHSEVSQR